MMEAGDAFLKKGSFGYWGRLFLALLFLPPLLVTLGLLRWRGLIPSARRERTPTSGEVFGVDVSSYRGGGLARPGGQGVDFAFIKATEAPSSRTGGLPPTGLGGGGCGRGLSLPQL